MVSSAKLALSALFQSIRSSNLGHNFKAFILRCLLLRLWPRFLRSLRKIWSWYFQINSNDENNTKGDLDTGGPSIGALRKGEKCVVFCASQAFGRTPVGGPSGHFMYGSGDGDAEQSIPMEGITRRNPSVPHNLSSHALVPSRQGSPRLLAAPSRQGSLHTSAASSLRSASSLQEENAPGSMEWFMHRSNTPVNWTHSRDVGRQFTGVSSRSYSRPSSPVPSLCHFPRPNTPMRSNIDIPTHLAMIQHSQDSEGSSPKIPEIKEPSRPVSLEATRSVYSFSPPQFPSVTAHGRTQSFPTHHRLPSTEFVDPSEDSKGHSPLVYRTHISAHQSRGSTRPEGSVTSQSTQAPPRPPFLFPESSLPHISTQAWTMNAGNSPFRPGTPLVRPMHSGQVSRYVKNGDV